MLRGLPIGRDVPLAFLRRHRGRVLGLVLANTRADADDEAARDRRHALAARLRSEGNVLAEAPPPLLSPAAPATLASLAHTSQVAVSFVAAISPRSAAYRLDCPPADPACEKAITALRAHPAVRYLEPDRIKDSR